MSLAFLTSRIAHQSRVQQWLASRSIDAARHMRPLGIATLHTRSTRPTASILSATAALPASVTSLSAMRMPLSSQHVRHFARKFGDDESKAQDGAKADGKQQQQQQAEETPSDAAAAHRRLAWQGIGIIFIVIAGVAYFIFRTPEEEWFWVRWSRSIRGVSSMHST
jgi:hypothetical protein